MFQQYQYNISYPNWAKTGYFTSKASCYWLAVLCFRLQAHQHSYQYSYGMRVSTEVRQMRMLIMKVLLTYHQEKMFQSSFIHLQKRTKDLSVAFSACTILCAALPCSAHLTYYLYNAI